MTEALDIVIIIIASGLGIGLGWLLAKMKFSTELVRAEVEAQARAEGRDEDGWMRHLYDLARQQAARRRIELPDFDDFWAQGYAESPEPEEP